jgi:hypothetical protein
MRSLPIVVASDELWRVVWKVVVCCVVVSGRCNPDWVVWCFRECIGEKGHFVLGMTVQLPRLQNESMLLASKEAAGIIQSCFYSTNDFKKGFRSLHFIFNTTFTVLAVVMDAVNSN